MKLDQNQGLVAAGSRQFATSKMRTEDEWSTSYQCCCCCRLLFLLYLCIYCFHVSTTLFVGRQRVEPSVALELRGGALEPSGVHVEQVVGRKGLPVVEQGLPGARGVDQVKLERVLLVLVVSVSIANAENARVVRQSTSAQAAACCSSFQVWSIVELGRAKLYRPVLHHDRCMMMMMMSALWTRSSVGLARAYLVEAQGCAAFGRGPRR
jgi:hypothetical protein